MTKQAEYFYEFGPFRIDPAQRLFWREGQIVPLMPKVFDTLLLMVENNGQVLEKAELMEELWPASFVEEGSLTQNISILRKLLGGNSGQQQQYIETLPRRGYRFVADVRQVQNPGFNLVVRRRTRARVTSTEEVSAEDEADAMRVLPDRGASIKSLAVLPFMTLGVQPSEEYLGLGLADALITQLSSTKQMIVRPTSAIRAYTDVHRGAVAVGRELRVNAVLEGAIQHSGDRLRVTLKLINVQDETSLWADKFQLTFTDIFDVQDTVAEKIASALLLKLSNEERLNLTKRHTESVAAYKAYLRGRYYWNKRSIEGYRKARDYFLEAIELDPVYALAYTGLADVFNALPLWGEMPAREACAKARAAALKALEIDDTLAETFASLGYTSMTYEWDWRNAEWAYRRSLELNPNYAPAHNWYAKMLVSRGRFDEALVEIRLAQELDPLSVSVFSAAGGPLLYARRYDEAIEHYRKVLELDPTFVPARFCLGLAYAQKGLHDEAIAESLKALELSQRHPVMLGALAGNYAVAGRSDEAQEVLEELQRSAPQQEVLAYSLATVHARLGECEQAFVWLERAFDDRNAHLLDLKIDPEFDNLRSDPRFTDLLQRLGLEP